MPWRNPIVAGEELALNSIQSRDYVPGVSGWAIYRNGFAEFLDVLVRGSITLEDLFAGTPGGPSFEIDGNTGLVTILGTTGLKVEIVPSHITPMLRFYSKNNNTFAYINQAALSPSQDGHATLGLNSGQYIAPDGGTRTIRMWLNSAQNSGLLQVVDSATQDNNGGYVIVQHDAAFIGYKSSASANQTYIRIVDGEISYGGPTAPPPNEVYGSVVVNAGGGVVVGVPVVWPTLEGGGTVRAIVTANTGSANVVNASISALGASGGTVNVLRNGTNTNTTTYYHVRREI